MVAGDQTALAILYDRYGGIVYSAVWRILNDTGAAEEILQDIFHQLWRTASAFDAARGTLPGWLLVTARNRAIDRLRRRRPEEGEELSENLIPLPFNLESSVAQQELVSKVKAWLSDLPPPQREALELAYFQGLTHSEIAQRTGEPLGTVKTRLRAALQTLRKAFTK
jgi:RNA polymerase sigma-70 factor (ECF subfamily)